MEEFLNDDGALVTTINLGHVVGPQGPAGEPGAPGEKGDPGEGADIDFYTAETIEDFLTNSSSDSIPDNATLQTITNTLLLNDSNVRDDISTVQDKIINDKAYNLQKAEDIANLIEKLEEKGLRGKYCYVLTSGMGQTGFVQVLLPSNADKINVNQNKYYHNYTCYSVRNEHSLLPSVEPYNVLNLRKIFHTVYWKDIATTEDDANTSWNSTSTVTSTMSYTSYTVTKDIKKGDKVPFFAREQGPGIEFIGTGGIGLLCIVPYGIIDWLSYDHYIVPVGQIKLPDNSAQYVNGLAFKAPIDMPTDTKFIFLLKLFN